MKSQNAKSDDLLLGDLFNAKIARLSPTIQKEVESWVVISLKVKMIKKLDNLLEREGKINARKLFLVPVFTISEMVERVEESAPEMKTFFFRELIATVDEINKRLG